MAVSKDTQRGTWQFVVRVTAADGSRKQMKRRGFATKKAAETAQAQIIADR